MITLIRREFTVDLPREAAWAHLAHVEQWPSWAKHIKHVKLEPPGELGANSSGQFRLTNGLKSAFAMTEFKPYDNWKWVGNFLWFTVHYDHHFEALSERRTKLTWIIEGEGFGSSFVGKLFAKIYNKNLDKAIPALVEEMNSRAGRQ